MSKHYIQLTIKFCTGLIFIFASVCTPVSAQEGQSYGGSTGSGGASSPHGSEGGGGAFGGGPNEGDLEGGGRSGFGYWGGRHVPTGPGGNSGLDTSGGASSTGYGAEGTLAGSCDDLSAEAVKSGNRLKGRNLVRINIAGAYLASDVTVAKIEKSGSPRRNLANYQEELEKPSPDTTVAGIYLGLVSMHEITPEVIHRINAILCVKTGPQQAAAIARIAEEQRQSIANHK